MSEEEQVHVRHEPEAHRYAIVLNGEVVGFTEYVERSGGGAYDFVHTEVDPAFGGRGLAGKLVAEALADTRRLGKQVIAHCPYVVAWLHKHPEFDTGIPTG